MKLLNQSKSNQMIAQIIPAFSIGQRLVGLLGRTSLDAHQAMWIRPCNNIHTWFMRFAIDVIFVDKNLKVKSIGENIKPFRIRWQLKAYSVFEMQAGAARNANIEIGDQLHVVD